MDEFAEINVTPFTDVLLVLLIIFMVMATLIVPAGFERALPHGSVMGPETPRYYADLTIARSGAMTLDGHVVDAASIYGAMRTLQAHHSRVTLAIDASTASAYSYTIRAMDAAKEAGINDVSFLTQ